MPDTAPPIGRLWLFVLAPMVGAVLAGVTYKVLLGEGRVTSLEAASRG